MVRKSGANLISVAVLISLLVHDSSSAGVETGPSLSPDKKFS